jgi:Amt family ammonium transporter
MNVALALICLMLVPMAAAGLALIHQGLGRSRSAGHAMLGSLCAMAIAAIVFVAVGSAFAGYAGGPAHAFAAGGARWDWIAACPMFARDLQFNSSNAGDLNRALLLCLEMFAAGLAAMVPLSAGADRWRLAAICAASALLAAIAFPLFVHWTWGGGWLAQMSTNLGISGFVDAGGAGVVQVVGGLMALVVAWIAGPRRGKFADDGMAAAIPGHNIVLVMFGCVLAMAGWAGLDGAVSILIYGAGPAQLAGVLINAMLAASGGCLAAVSITRTRYRKPDASLSANGWIAGLVAGSAACAMVSPMISILIGMVAGALVTYTIEFFELRLQLDDPGGAISVHAGAGIWGLLAVGLFGNFTAGSRGEHVLAQMVGVAALLGFILPLLYGASLLLNRFVPFRVDSDGEWQGMDIRELGAGAYPEFVVHADDFTPR